MKKKVLVYYTVDYTTEVELNTSDEWISDYIDESVYENDNFFGELLNNNQEVIENLPIPEIQGVNYITDSYLVYRIQPI